MGNIEYKGFEIEITPYPVLKDGQEMWSARASTLIKPPGHQFAGIAIIKHAGYRFGGTFDQVWNHMKELIDAFLDN